EERICELEVAPSRADSPEQRSRRPLAKPSNRRFFVAHLETRDSSNCKRIGWRVLLCCVALDERNRFFNSRERVRRSPQKSEQEDCVQTFALPTDMKQSLLAVQPRSATFPFSSFARRVFGSFFPARLM